MRASVGAHVTAAPPAVGGRWPAPAAARSGRRRCRSPTTSVPLWAINRPSWRRSAGSNAPNVRRSSGAVAMNASGGQRRDPAVDHVEQLGVVHEHGAAARQEPLDERRAGGRRGADRQRTRQPGTHQRPVPRAAVVQQPRGPPCTRPCTSPRSATTVEHRRPLGSPSRMVDQRRARPARRPAARPSLPRHRRRASGTPSTTPASTRTTKPSNTARQRTGVGAAHVAVAQCPGERTERVDDLDDVGVVRGLGLDAGRRPAAPPRAGRRAGATSSTRDEVGQRSTAAARSSRRCVAAACTVVPCAGGSMTRIVSSGSHSRRHVSRNVPLLPDLPRPCPTARRGRAAGASSTRAGPAVRVRGHRARPSARVGRRLQPDPRLLRGEVAGQRHLRSVVGHLADRVADDQLVARSGVMRRWRRP